MIRLVVLKWFRDPFFIGAIFLFKNTLYCLVNPRVFLCTHGIFGKYLDYGLKFRRCLEQNAQ